MGASGTVCCDGCVLVLQTQRSAAVGILAYSPVAGCWLSLLVGLCFDVCESKERVRRAKELGESAERGVVTVVGIPIVRGNRLSGHVNI